VGFIPMFVFGLRPSTIDSMSEGSLSQVWEMPAIVPTAQNRLRAAGREVGQLRRLLKNASGANECRPDYPRQQTFVGGASVARRISLRATRIARPPAFLIPYPARTCFGWRRPLGRHGREPAPSKRSESS